MKEIRTSIEADLVALSAPPKDDGYGYGRLPEMLTPPCI